MKKSLDDLKATPAPSVNFSTEKKISRDTNMMSQFTKSTASTVIDTKKAISDNIELAKTYGSNAGKAAPSNKTVAESKSSIFAKMDAIMTDFGYKIGNISMGKVTIGEKIPKIKQNPKLTGYSATASSILAVIALILMIKRSR